MKISSDATASGMVTARWKQTQVPRSAGLFQPTTFAKPIDSLDSANTAATEVKYDRDAAYLMSIVSAWSYSDEKALGSMLRHYGIENVSIRRVTVQNNALLVVTTAYLIQSESGRSAVLAFRGTDPADFVAILTDAQVMQLPFLTHKVHAGFRASVEVVWDDVHDALMSALHGIDIARDGQRKDELQSLYITGHSLGGAMAIIASARLFGGAGYDELTPRVKGIYTFGQPMVGDAAFADLCERRFGSRLFRHVFRNDVVPRLPPRFLRDQIEYLHAGHDYRSPGLEGPWVSTKYRSSRANGFVFGLAVLFNALKDRGAFSFFMRRRKVADPGMTVSIDDHSPANYLEASRASIGKPAAGVAPK
jgi:hypothetical protein